MYYVLFSLPYRSITYSYHNHKARPPRWQCGTLRYRLSSGPCCNVSGAYRVSSVIWFTSGPCCDVSGAYRVSSVTWFTSDPCSDVPVAYRVSSVTWFPIPNTNTTDYYNIT
uniref:Uncharacterized protein n=1 Tax=Cacopsylla melanoneura TaxID=428564 RepID=A0A8D9A1E7_9HEMI